MQEAMNGLIGPGIRVMVLPCAVLRRTRRSALDLLLVPAQVGAELMVELVHASMRMTYAMWAEIVGAPAAEARTGVVDVTFRLPAAVGARSAHVCGEFNGWSTTADPMDRRDDGGFELVRSLPVGRRWRFRYLLDGNRWENDWEADDYPPNAFGDHDSVVDLRTPSTSRLVSGRRPGA